MKITLLCPDCNQPLKDRFSAENVSLVAGITYTLEMECLNCDSLVDISLDLSLKVCKV